MQSVDNAPAAVHVLLPTQGDKAKSGTTFKETQATSEAQHNYEGAAASSDWSAQSLWTLFAVGWLLAPCWWVGVASGFQFGVFCKRRKALNASQVAAWYAHIFMTVASTVIIVVCCSVLVGKKAAGPAGAGPVYSDPYYMTMVGDAAQIPDFSNPSTLRSAAQGIYNAFGLDSELNYPVTSIRVWEEGRSPVARTRHLLQGGKQVVIIGYAFAQPEAGQTFPEAAAIRQTVATAAGKITASLVSAGVLSEAAASSLVVGLLTPETKPLEVQNLLKEGLTVILAMLEKLEAKPVCSYKAAILERPFNFSDLNFPANGTGCVTSGPRIDFEDLNDTSLGEAVQAGYKNITWTNFAVFNKDKIPATELMCNSSSIAQATAIGSVAAMVPQPPAQDNGHEAELSVADSSTQTLALRGLFVWSLMRDATLNITAFNDMDEVTATDDFALQALIPQHLSLTQPGFHNATSVLFSWSFTSSVVCQEQQGMNDQVPLILDELELATVAIGPHVKTA